MPPEDPDKRPVGRPPKFDRAMKDRYLEHIRSGSLPRESARIVGIDYSTVRRHAQADQSFYDEIVDAREHATEAVEKVLYEAALAGEPWAVGRWMEANDRTKYGKKETVEVTGKVVHELEASEKLTEIVAMRKALEERYATVHEIEAVDLDRTDD